MYVLEMFYFNLHVSEVVFNDVLYALTGRAGRSDTTVGSLSWCRCRVSEVGGQKCRKSRCRSPVLSSNTSTLFEKRRHFLFEMEMSSLYDRVFYFF